MKTLLIAFFTGIFCLSAAAASHAAPVTFRFEAEIDRLSGIPFDSAVNFAVGDVIAGQFTVEPADGDGNMKFESVQPFEFKFSIKGVRLSTPSFEIEAVNNAPIFDFPMASVIDSIRVSAAGLSPAVAAEFPNIDAATSGFRMTLYSPAASLDPENVPGFDQASIPGSVDIWNEFILRRQLSLSLRNGNGGVVGFQATIDDFTVVPEPPAGCLAFLIFLGVITGHRSGFFRDSLNLVTTCQGWAAL